MANDDSIGPSICRWEPPDIVCSVFIGDISLPEMRRLIHEADALVGGRTDVFGMIDLSQTGNIPPESRAYARTATTHMRLRATAIIGASFHHRVIAMLANKAAALLRPNHQPLGFFSTKAEALAWFDKLRRGER